MPLDHYERAAWCLAYVMLGVIERGMVQPYFEHFDENSLHAVPDMLTRLGVMRQHGFGRHCFVEDWDPAFPLKMQHHAGEPTLEDLGLGIDFCIAWYGPMSHLRGGAEHVHLWEQNGLVQTAVSLGRGILVDGVYMPEDDRGEGIIEDYWISRSRVASALGGEKQLYPECETK